MPLTMRTSARLAYIVFIRRSDAFRHRTSDRLFFVVFVWYSDAFLNIMPQPPKGGRGCLISPPIYVWNLRAVI